jgi:tRNA1(Val) A37 N6-methylase TrmN6
MRIFEISQLNLTFENLAEIASRLLNSNGKISIVIPFLKLEEVIKSFKCFELHLSRINHVKHTKQNQTSISLLEFQMVRSDLVITSDFFIRDENGFSEVYKNLLSDFLIIF